MYRHYWVLLLLLQSIMTLSYYSKQEYFYLYQTKKKKRSIGETMRDGKGFSPNEFKEKSFKILIYLFIRCEFWNFNHWITCFYNIFHAYKIPRKSKINNCVFNQMIKFQVFVVQMIRTSIDTLWDPTNNIGIFAQES